MELPTSIEQCHRMIRELADENAVLRKSGNDFGHLAERLNAALREERQYASDLPVARKTARTSPRQTRPMVSEDGAGRWSTSEAGLQTYAASPAPSHSPRTRTPSRGPRARSGRWVL